MNQSRILVCRCANADVIPETTKAEVLRRIVSTEVPVDIVDDLCGLAANKDPRLGELVDGERPLTIAACFPRAVKWLFHHAGFPLPATGVEICNIKTDNVDTVLDKLLGEDRERNTTATAAPEPAAAHKPASRDSVWNPWFPVIDYERCTQCMQCLSFCLFDVYAVDAEKKILVQHPRKCKANCPACARVCPEVAIIFPKYGTSPIDGGDVTPQDLAHETMKVDISALMGGDVHRQLRRRQKRAKDRFSKEKDEQTALMERMRHLQKLQAKLDIPPEVLAVLPRQADVQKKLKAAAEKMRQAGPVSEEKPGQNPADKNRRGSTD